MDRGRALTGGSGIGRRARDRGQSDDVQYAKGDPSAGMAGVLRAFDSELGFGGEQEHEGSTGGRHLQELQEEDDEDEDDEDEEVEDAPFTREPQGRHHKRGDPLESARYSKQADAVQQKQAQPGHAHDDGNWLQGAQLRVGGGALHGGAPMASSQGRTGDRGEDEDADADADHFRGATQQAPGREQSSHLTIALQQAGGASHGGAGSGDVPASLRDGHAALGAGDAGGVGLMVGPASGSARGGAGENENDDDKDVLGGGGGAISHGQRDEWDDSD